MILYYSSTGNSHHIAKEISKSHPGRLADMAKAGKGDSYRLEDGETLFIVTYNCF